MRTILYYIPNGVAATQAAYERAGLAGVLRDTHPAWRTVCGGPDGGNGLLVRATWREDNEAPVYTADAQRWIVAPGGRHWVGVATGEEPGPEDLRRKTQIEGHWVRLGDGRDWLVPVARLVDGTTLLPEAVYWDVNGALVRELRPEYAPLHQHATAIWDSLMDSGRYSADADALYAVAADALAANYHVGRAEVGLLGLLDRQAVTRVAWALVDGPTLDAIAESKKNETDGGSAGAAGAEGNCQGTPRPLESA